VGRKLDSETKMALSEALAPYYKFSLFPMLFEAVVSQMSIKEEREREFLITKCNECGKHFLVHRFEIINPVFNSDQHTCRKCNDNWDCESIIDVPAGIPMLLHRYSLINRYLQRENFSDKEIEYLGTITTFDHPLELQVVSEELREGINKLIYPNRYRISVFIQNLLAIAKEINYDEFEKFTKYFNELNEPAKQLTSAHVTNESSKIFEQIQEKYGDLIFEFLFPHPIKGERDILSDPDELYFDRINDIANLYKDLLDLQLDHIFLCNLGNMLKGKPFNPECIPVKVFGSKLLDITKEHVKETCLEEFVTKYYNSKLRNAIAHPLRYVDRVTKEVSLFNNGKLQSVLPWNEFMEQVTPLIELHEEIGHAITQLAFEYNAEFLGTAGILSFEPYDESGNGGDSPMLMINQIRSFKRFNPNIDWANEIKVLPLKRGDEKGISITVFRKGLRNDTYPTDRSSQIQFGPYINNWLKAVIDDGFISVIHRECIFPNMDLDHSGGWILEVPVDSLKCMKEICTGIMDNAGEIYLGESLKISIKSAMGGSQISVVKVPRNGPCPCGSGKKYKKCCGKNLYS
jgi:hypothetical protein